MSSLTKFVILLAVLTQLCVGTEFTAFCDICRLKNPSTKCPEDLSCASAAISIEYDGIKAKCGGTDHILSLFADSAGLKSLPDSLNEMTHLTIMSFASNSLTELPVLDQLTDLTTVYLSSNKINNLAGVFSSSNLKYIMANDNNLTEIPAEWAELDLAQLNVANNQLTSIPEAFNNGHNIDNLNIDQNMLDCPAIWKTFAGNAFADKCIPAQQKTGDDGPLLPLDYIGEPAHAGLDGYEISAIILFVLFVCLLVAAIVLYKYYRSNGGSTHA